MREEVNSLTFLKKMIPNYQEKEKLGALMRKK